MHLKSIWEKGYDIDDDDERELGLRYSLGDY